MDGFADSAVAAHDPQSGRFTVGHSEYRARAARLAERVRELATIYDAPSFLLRPIAVQLDVSERGRTVEARRKALSTANRLLSKLARKEAPTPSMAEFALRYTKETTP
jgi:FixJ family two-component response regulator